MTNLKRELTQIVEMDVDRCLLTYGTAPCTAVLGTSGVRKCYNTFRTCQDTPNFTPSLEPAMVLAPLNEDYFVPAGRTDFDGITGDTFTRSTTATYTDARGTLQTAAIDEARVNHHLFDGTSFERAGMLVEEAATNQREDSNDFSQNGSTSNASITASAGSSPLGTNAATDLVPNVSNTVHRWIEAAVARTATTMTYSLFVKANGYSQIGLRESTSTGASAVFDLTNGTVDGIYNAGNFTVISTSIEDFGGGDYRISFTLQDAGTTTQRLGVYVLDGSWTSGDAEGVTFAGDGTSGILMSGLQVEAGAVPSSYIPTSGATVARGADNLRIPAAVTAKAMADAAGSPELTTDGDMTNPASWVLGAGWAIGAGLATHTPGSSSRIRQLIGISNGDHVILVTTVTGMTAGSVTPDLRQNNDTNLITGNAITSDGVYLDLITSDANTNSVGFACSSDFDGSISTASARIVTMPAAISGSMHNLLTYADLGSVGQITLFDQRVDVNNRVTVTMDTDGAKTGTFTLTMVNGGSSATVSTSTEITPGNNVGANISWSADAATIGIALNGVDVESATAIGVPDLVTAAAVVFDSGGVAIIERWLSWFVNITSAGRIEATS